MTQFSTSRSHKPFELSPEQLAAQTARRAAVKGPEYGLLDSVFIGLHRGATKADILHEAFFTNAGKKVFRPKATFSETLQSFADDKPQGIISTAGELVKYAKALQGQYKFKYILSTGTLMTPERAKLILDVLLAPGGAAYSTYGCAEVGTIARVTLQQVQIYPGCVGTPTTGVEVQIRDGLVWVKTPDVISEYKAKKFNVALKDGWFNTGDKGEMKGSQLFLQK